MSSSTGASSTQQRDQDAATLLRRWFDEVWNQRREQAIDQLLAKDARMWGVGRPDVSSTGAAEFKQFYRAICSAFPDTTITLDHVASDGDTAFARWTVKATHTGDSLGTPATNSRLNIVGMSACRVKDGMIVEAWNIWDQIGMARQLGMLTAPIATLFP
jgi:steroid delta-isomerase-like uncharacterized protein